MEGIWHCLFYRNGILFWTLVCSLLFSLQPSSWKSMPVRQRNHRCISFLFLFCFVLFCFYFFKIPAQDTKVWTIIMDKSTPLPKNIYLVFYMEICGCPSSPKEQDQEKHVYGEKDLLSELAYAVMGAKKSWDLQASSWRPRKANGGASVHAWRPETRTARGVQSSPRTAGSSQARTCRFESEAGKDRSPSSRWSIRHKECPPTLRRVRRLLQDSRLLHLSGPTDGKSKLLFAQHCFPSISSSSGVVHLLLVFEALSCIFLR